MISLVQVLQEVIEDEIARLRHFGMRPIDRFDSGPYKMLLLKNDSYHLGSWYDVSLTSDDEDFTTPYAQRSRSLGREFSTFSPHIFPMIEKLLFWSQKYGDLRIGSMNRAKTIKYRKLMIRYKLNVGEIKDVSGGNYFILYGNNFAQSSSDSELSNNS